MSGPADEHRQRIIDQFTRQAVPFSRMPPLTNGLILDGLGLTAADDVLDVACGPGLIALEMARAARHVTGLDVTRAMLDLARERQAEAGLANLSWVEGEAYRMPFPDGAFAVAFTRYSFHHLFDPAAAFAEMVRVCRPGGRVAVVDAYSFGPEQGAAYDHVEKLRDPSHVRALPLSELTGLFAGLGDVAVRPFRHPFPLEGVLEHSFPARTEDADEVRRLIRADIGRDRLGFRAAERDGELHVEFPVVMVTGRKPG